MRGGVEGVFGVDEGRPGGRRLRRGLRCFAGALRAEISTILPREAARALGEDSCGYDVNGFEGFAEPHYGAVSNLPRMSSMSDVFPVWGFLFAN